MKILLTLAVGGFATLATIAPATAQHRMTHRTTTVTTTRVHGPARFLPHHRVKRCQVKIVARHRVKKCNYY